MSVHFLANYLERPCPDEPSEEELHLAVLWVKQALSMSEVRAVVDAHPDPQQREVMLNQLRWVEKLIEAYLAAEAKLSNFDHELFVITSAIWSEKDPRVLRGDLITAKEVVDYLDELLGRIGVLRERLDKLDAMSADTESRLKSLDSKLGLVVEDHAKLLSDKSIVYVVEHREDVKGSNHLDTVVMALFWTEKEALDYVSGNAVAELKDRQWYTIYSQVVGSEEGVGRPLIHVDRFGRVSRKVQPGVNMEFSFRPEDCEE